MTCEKMHAPRIPVTTCIGRQTKGILIKGDGGGIYSLIPVECRECEAGRAALAGNQLTSAPPPSGIPEGEKKDIVTKKGGRKPGFTRHGQKRRGWPKGVPRTERRKKMAAKRGCSNCKRDKALVSGGLCFVCLKAARGKVGPARDAALAEIKRKLDAGEIKTKNFKRRGSAAEPGRPSSPASSPAPVIPEAKPGDDAGPGDTMPHRVPGRGAAETPTIVPITLRLAIEISVKFNGVGINA